MPKSHHHHSRRKSKRKSRRRFPMRGWIEFAPKHGRQRSTMRSKCGSKCFLKPSTNGFPICSRGTCKHSCRGLLAAKIRAIQYGYSSIAISAQSIAHKNKCPWAKKRSRKVSRRRSRKVSRRRSRKVSRRRSRKVSHC